MGHRVGTCHPSRSVREAQIGGGPLSYARGGLPTAEGWQSSRWDVHFWLAINLALWFLVGLLLFRDPLRGSALLAVPVALTLLIVRFQDPRYRRSVSRRFPLPYPEALERLDGLLAGRDVRHVVPRWHWVGESKRRTVLELEHGGREVAIFVQGDRAGTDVLVWPDPRDEPGVEGLLEGIGGALAGPPAS